MSIIEVVKKYESNILSKLGLSYDTLVWCELGNQMYQGLPAKGEL